MTATAVGPVGAVRVWTRRRSSALWSRMRADKFFTAVFLLGAVLRACAVLGFRPILLFNDGMEYLGVALRMQPYVVRPDGYSWVLRALLPFHQLALVATLQHLMGLATALMLYALLRRWRVRRWLATLGVAPQLLDVHQIQLEQLLLSDTMFTFLAVSAVTVAAWRQKLTPRSAAVLGLLAAAAALTRTIGLPLLVVLGLFLLVRWAGWRPVVAFALAVVIPLGAYAAWFHSVNGSYQLTESDGVFLYSRTAVFADCSKIKPPPELALLCPTTPVSQRENSNGYIWHVGSPLRNLPGHVNGEPIPTQIFTPQRNSFGRSFGLHAILAQPWDYFMTGWRDFLRTFAWTRQPYPMASVIAAYTFSNRPYVPEVHNVFVVGATAQQDLNTYQPGSATPRSVQPFADVLIGYQHFGFVPGPLIAVLLIIGLVGALAWWRRDERRWQVGLLFTVGLMLLLVPPYTAEFDYRYVLPALPVLGAMAALAIAVLVPKCSDPVAAAADPVGDGDDPGVETGDGDAADETVHGSDEHEESLSTLRS